MDEYYLWEITLKDSTNGILVFKKELFAYGTCQVGNQS